jgi:hypothetical protein
VELHKEHEARLVQAMRGAQECMAVDADELRRDARRIELFEAHLLTVAEKIQASGHALQEDLKVHSPACLSEPHQWPSGWLADLTSGM